MSASGLPLLRGRCSTILPQTISRYLLVNSGVQVVSVMYRPGLVKPEPLGTGSSTLVLDGGVTGSVDVTLYTKYVSCVSTTTGSPGLSLLMYRNGSPWVLRCAASPKLPVLA